MTHSKTSRLAIIAACISCLAGFCASASAQVVLVADTFSLTETRHAGDSLQGLAPEIGSGTWSVQESSGNANALFSDNGTIISQSTGNNLIEARIGITPPSGSIITTSSTFVNATTDWLGIGFLTSTSFSNGWNGNGNLLTVYLRPNGDWQISSNKNTSSRTIILTGAIADFDSNAPYTLALSFDLESLQASLSWASNSASGSSEWVNTGLTPTTAALISAAGFRANPTSGSTSGDYYIDNFEVLSNIPEPGSIALILGGIALIGVGFRRRASRTGQGS